MPAPVANMTYTDLPVLYPENTKRGSVSLPGGVNYPAGTILGFRGTAIRNEVQTITVNGGGTFRIGTVDGNYTGNIAVAANAAAIQTALDGLLGPNNVVVTGTGPFTLTFQGEYGYKDLALLLLDTALNTTTPSTIAKTTRGSAGPGLSAEVTDGSTINARVLLCRDTQTDMKGCVKTQWSQLAGNVAAMDYTAGVIEQGMVEAKYIPLITSTTAGQLGKLQRGNAVTDVGAVVSVGY